MLLAVVDVNMNIHLFVITKTQSVLLFFYRQDSYRHQILLRYLSKTKGV